MVELLFQFLIWSLYICSFRGRWVQAHTGQCFAMFSSWWVISGHQTEILTRKWHLCTPWFPMCSFSSVCPCKHFGTTIYIYVVVIYTTANCSSQEWAHRGFPIRYEHNSYVSLFWPTLSAIAHDWRTNMHNRWFELSYIYSSIYPLLAGRWVTQWSTCVSTSSCSFEALVLKVDGSLDKPSAVYKNFPGVWLME